VQRRVELAFSLERYLMAGGGEEAYLEEVGSVSPQALVLELEEHLRALLRDVLCGYLDADLRAAADDVLLESSKPLDIRARDLRTPPAPLRPPRAPDAVAAERPVPPAGAAAPVSPEEDEGVTPSEDWVAEDEAASYSAPV
jgi:hypothetical protein